MNTPLYGLVLAGGRSTRMRQDKAGLAYHGRSQLERAAELLAPLVERTFVSVRADQRDDPVRAHFEQIVDQHAGLGPAAGILAAQARHPEAAWLVLACDLPFLDAGTLETLKRVRDAAAGRLATAYRSAHDRLPEPLCAIWEPASREPLKGFVAGGRSCPRKFLIQTPGVELIELPDPRALDNVNTPEEYGAAMSSIASQDAPTVKPVRIQYYALLREQARRSDERLDTEAATPRELYEQLRTRHGFTLPTEMLRVAVNGEFGDWSQPLSAGDEIVFIPPVAGG
ncbi:MAG: NTP transferase domain-containing protein [Gammaproteobacteria bacterium]|nr:NTP transferase domain-containing protein [Gammaproteobacteria bacterium]